MRIAITADNHLTSIEKHPERFETLKHILQQCGESEVDQLIFAGDLFDGSRQNFADFEGAYKEAYPGGYLVLIIPGNHDANLVSGAFALEGLQVIDEPTVIEAGDAFELLLVPYKSGTTLGEHIASCSDELEAGQWALVSHGDWLEGLRVPDPREPGVYMPLSRADLQKSKPALVLLGHIHAPWSDGTVHYPGSPCPLHVNETGLRRLLIYDTEEREVSEERVNSPVLYFNEEIVMLPYEDEEARLREILESRAEAWNLPEEWEDRVQVRLRISGYVRDRAAVETVAREILERFSFYEGSPDLAGLNLATDRERIEIARQAKELIDSVELQDGPGKPDKSEMTAEALAVIYGS